MDKETYNSKEGCLPVRIVLGILKPNENSARRSIVLTDLIYDWGPNNYGDPIEIYEPVSREDVKERSTDEYIKQFLNELLYEDMIKIVGGMKQAIINIRKDSDEKGLLYVNQEPPQDEDFIEMLKKYSNDSHFGFPVVGWTWCGSGNISDLNEEDFEVLFRPDVLDKAKLFIHNYPSYHIRNHKLISMKTGKEIKVV